MNNSKIAKATSLQITDGLTVTVYENSDHGFLIKGKEISNALKKTSGNLHDAILRGDIKNTKQDVYYVSRSKAINYGVFIGAEQRLFTARGFYAIACRSKKGTGNVDVVVDFLQVYISDYYNNNPRFVNTKKTQYGLLLDIVERLDRVEKLLMGGR